MKCPCCKQIMENKNDSWKFGPYQRIDMHCTNEWCPALNEINYVAHMSVLDIDSILYNFGHLYSYEYHLPFKFKNVWYHLIGKQEAFNCTVLRTDADPKPLIIIDYMPISPEYIDVESYSIFMRLIKLLPFS